MRVMTIMMNKLDNFFEPGRVALFSDLHIGVHSNSPNWHQISYEWAQWYTEMLRGLQIKNVIFCGDFFHDRSSVNLDSLKIGSDILALFADFKLILIAGNHCSFYKDSARVNSLAPFRHWPNIKVVDSCVESFTHMGQTWTLCPWGSLLRDMPESDIIFGHFEIRTFKMNSFRMCEEGLSIRKILEKAPLIFSGHFHFRDEREMEIGRIIYVGNPFQTDLNDAGNEKGFYIIDENSKVDFVPNTHSPLIIKWKLTELISMPIKEIANGIKKNNVRIDINEYITDEDYNVIHSRLSSFSPRSIVFEKTFQATIGIDATWMSQSVDIESTLTEFVDIMAVEYKTELSEYVVDIHRKYSTSK